MYRFVRILERGTLMYSVLACLFPQDPVLPVTEVTGTVFSGICDACISPRGDP